VLFVFATAFPPLEVTTEVNLLVHMLQHVTIAISGACIGYPLYKSGRLDRVKKTSSGLLGFLAITFLLVLWHIPFFWDSAVESLYVHVAEHFCFLLIGVLIGSTLPMLPDNYKMFIIVLAISAHMFYGFALYLTSTPVYPLYTVSQQQMLGIALFGPSPIYFIGYLYVNLTRESRILIERESKHKVLPTDSWGKKTHLLLGVLSLFLIALLVAYFAATGAVIFLSGEHAGTQTSVIYIEETPIYWQYSPRSITVIIGVNNTVEWVSHSFAYDTVTSSTGLFSSGSIAPGGTYTYTFTQPGTYSYYCQYHLWMTGTIIVKSSAS
jgi:plastocyanin